jgi:hypothetical protein
VQVSDNSAPGIRAEGQRKANKYPYHGHNSYGEKIHYQHIKHIALWFETTVKECKSYGHKQDQCGAC